MCFPREKLPPPPREICVCGSDCQQRCPMFSPHEKKLSRCHFFALAEVCALCSLSALRSVKMHNLVKNVPIIVSELIHKKAFRCPRPVPLHSGVYLFQRTSVKGCIVYAEMSTLKPEVNSRDIIK